MNAFVKVLFATILGASVIAAAASDATVRKPSAPPAATQGIEPDEIDARQRSTAPTPRPARVATPPRKPPVGTVPTPGRFAPAVDPNGTPQGYETADCSTETKTISCCTSNGEGGSCNLFILLCNETGGVGKGDGGDAICVE